VRAIKRDIFISRWQKVTAGICQAESVIVETKINTLFYQYNLFICIWIAESNVVKSNNKKIE